MPGTKNEPVYAFPATQMNEGGIVGNVKATIPAIKFVLRYCYLKEK